MRRTGVLVLALLALPTFALAQSLGEVAAQEKARREKAKEAGKKPQRTKTFTDADLQGGASGDKTGAPPPPEPAVQAGPSSAGGPDAAEEGESGPKTQWRQRAAQARQGVQTAQQAVSSYTTDVERIGQELNPMSLSYNNEDVNRILRLQAELTEAQAQLAKANQQLAVAEKAYKEFEDEARRAGVPPSWLVE
jgi:DNA repair exonuclease SbcCD ATPase subunit